MRWIFYSCHFFAFLIGLSRAFRLNMIAVINGDNPLYGYISSGAAYDVAFEKLLPRFPELLNNASRYMIYEPGSFACGEAAILMYSVAAKVSALLDTLQDDFNIIVSPGCSLEIIVLGDFAREWNVPLFSSISSDAALLDKNRFPTVITFSPVNHGTLSSGAKLFLDAYSWRTVTFLCDTLSQYPGLSAFYGLSCANVKAKLQARIGYYTIYQSTFDSATFGDYKSLLENAKRQSRVIFVFTRPSILRNFLIQAHNLSMTNGDYVFLASELTTVPTFGNLSWRYSSVDDQAAFDGFRSLITFVNTNPNWNTIHDLVDSIAAVTKKKYNKNVTEDSKYNDLAIAAYEAYTSAIQVLNESYNIPKLDGRRYSALFWNRTFHLPTRTIKINSAGMRLDDVEFSKLNVTSGDLQVGWRFSALDSSLTTVSGLAFQWRSPAGPPRDHPVCGFSGNMCTPGRSSQDQVVIIAVVLGVAVTVLAVSGACYWRYCGRTEANSQWWWIVVEDEKNDETRSKSKTKGNKLTGNVLQKCKMFAKEKVWVETITGEYNLDHINNRKILRTTLATIRNFRHDNIGKFYGILVRNCTTQLTYEFGFRDNVRSVLDNGKFTVDYALQNSMIWEILAGIDYIQASALSYHGFISSLCLMVDKRFRIKICSYGFPQFLLSLVGSNTPSAFDLSILWMAPEMIFDSKCPGSKLTDIFSIGLVITEILTKHSPLDLLKLHNNAVSPNTLLKLDRRMSTASLSPALSTLIASMTFESPAERPTIKQLMNRMRTILPRSEIVATILKRLSEYSTDLEARVLERSKELEAESAKVDALLREMIPAKFIYALRNKQPFLPESFDSVTILFSHFHNFAQICTHLTPLEVIKLLGNSYSSLDVLLARYDVYKVETISDSYVIVSGLPSRNVMHVHEIAKLSLAMLSLANSDATISAGQIHMQIRIGFHSGPCAAGVVGLRMPRYCLFGDTVNTASRMESYGEASRIHISENSASLLDGVKGFRIDSRGRMFIKGKGEVETFWLLGAL